MCATLPLAPPSPPSPQVWYQTAGAEWRRVLWLWQSCVNIRSSWTTRRVRADKCFIRVSRQPRRVFQLGERPPPPGSLRVYVSQVETVWIIDVAAFCLRDLITFERQKKTPARCSISKRLENFPGKAQRQGVLRLVIFDISNYIFTNCIAKI